MYNIVLIVYDVLYLAFNSPFVIPTSNTGTTGAVNSSVSEDNIMIISSLGFTREQAIKALKATV